MIPKRIMAVLAPRPGTVDYSTEQGRSDERHRRVVLSAVASMAAKVLSVLTSLISVPLTLHYLGAERYGMWLTMSSLVAMLAFADLGVGNGLLNAVADANGKDNRLEMKVSISSGFLALSRVALVILFIFAAVYDFVDWPQVFNVKSALARAEAGPALAIFVICFALAIPMGVVQRVQMGLQRGFLASMWQCAASLLGLVGVIAAIKLEASLLWLVLAYLGAPLLASVINSFIYFFWIQPDIRPALRSASYRGSKKILKTGGLFLILQLVVAVAYTSDGIIVAQLVGASAVAEYAVPEKMFGVVASILAMMLAPLWPAYGEAIARGDHEWVRKTLKRSLVLVTAASTLVSLVLVLAGGKIINLWVSGAVVPPFALLLGLGVWKVFETIGNTLAVYLNGANVVGTQVVISILMAVSALTLKFIFIHHMGISGVPWATTLAFIICAVIPYAFILPRLLAGKP
jgi:O-antigen/teichoic acid export membrane protein